MKLLQIMGIVLAIFSLQSVFSVNAQLTISVSASQLQNQKNHTLAIVPLGFDFESFPVASQFRAIMMQDLSRFGPFALMSQNDMLVFPQSVDEVDSNEWLSIGAEYVVVGALSVKDTGLFSMEIAVYDLIRRKVLSQVNLKEDGSGWRALAHRASLIIHREILGSWGPYESKLAYVVRGGAEPYPFRLHQADADGYFRRELFKSADPILSPTWHPNGRLLAFSVLSKKGQTVQILDTENMMLTKIGNWSWDTGSPSFSASGNNIALSITKFGNRDVYVYNFNSKKLVRITDHFAVDTEPNYSFDGTEILFTSDRSGTPQVYKFNLLTGALQRLSKQGNYNARASFIGSDKLIYVHRSDTSVWGTSRKVAIADDTGQIQQLLDGHLFDESPSYIPGSNILSFVVQEDTVSKFVGYDFILNKNLAFLIADANISDPVWWSTFR